MENESDGLGGARDEPATSVRSEGPGVSLGKVSLTKIDPSVSLTKSGAARGLLRVNLNWNSRPGNNPTRSSGMFKRLTAPSIDLDLGCLFQYTDGSVGVVQALGNAFRDRHTLGPDPICWLDGDDRSGSNSDGENLFVNLRHLGAIRRILVFAYIYEGVPNWAAADGLVTMFPASGPRIEVRLDESRAGASMCGIAMLENTGNDLVVRREVRYVGGHRELDSTFRWGLRWTAGRK